MIGTLEALETYLRALGQEEPSLAAECVLIRPGIDEAACVALRTAFPGLPESYLACARTFRFTGVQVGGFLLSPMAGRGTLVDGLLRTNSAVNPAWPRLSNEGFVEVALGESDLVAVACKGSRVPEGSVLALDLFDLEEAPALLASSFEKFLLYAGNMMQISAQLDGEEAVDELAERLVALGATEIMVDGWSSIAEEFFF